MPIPTLDVIHQKAEVMGLSIINAISNPQNNMQIDIIDNADNSINILEQFLNLVKTLGQTYFFIDINIYNQEILESFLIDIEAITEDIYGISYKSIKKAAKEHNKSILSLPTNKPASLELFVYLRGCLYTLGFEEDWCNSLIEADDALERIVSQFSEYIYVYKEQKEQSKLSKRKDLELEIIKDPIFKNCSTKAARMAFVEQFLFEHSEDIPRGRAGLEGWCDLLLAKSKTT